MVNVRGDRSLLLVGVLLVQSGCTETGFSNGIFDAQLPYAESLTQFTFYGSAAACDLCDYKLL